MTSAVFLDRKRCSDLSLIRHPQKTALTACAMAARTAGRAQVVLMNQNIRLRKHADYQRVYKASRKQFSSQMTFFFAMREENGPASVAQGASGPRVGLTVGKVMGKAVDRNRIKRRMREAVRRSLNGLKAPVDIVLHPRRAVIDIEFAALEREVSQVFRKIEATLARGEAKPAAAAAGVAR
jgi:ribonuclease P protein component